MSATPSAQDKPQPANGTSPDTSQQQEQTPSSTSNKWDEANYVAALKRLQEVQDEITTLRTALPSLIASLTPLPSQYALAPAGHGPSSDSSPQPTLAHQQRSASSNSSSASPARNSQTSNPAGHNATKQPTASNAPTPSTPEAVYASFATAATETFAGIKRLRKAFEGPEVKRALKRARISARERAAKQEGEDEVGEGVPDWFVGFEDEQQEADKQGLGVVEGDAALADAAKEAEKKIKQEQRKSSDYGLFEAEDDEEEANSSQGGQSQQRDAEADAVESVDVQSVVQDFKERHVDVDVNHLQDENLIDISFLASGQFKLHFNIKKETNEQGKTQFSATCTEGPEGGNARGSEALFESISRALDARPRKGDLKLVLDMILSYKDVLEAPCAKCGKMLDANALVPTARRKKERSDGEDTEWEAFHEMCG